MTVSAGTRSATGRFFEQLVNRDALPMPTRKLTAMLHTYGNLTLIPVVIAVVMFLLLVLRRPGRDRAGALEPACERVPMPRWECRHTARLVLVRTRGPSRGRQAPAGQAAESRARVTGFQRAEFHSRTVLSWAPVARVLPSGLNVTK
jgi:hypothetical protein